MSKHDAKPSLISNLVIDQKLSNQRRAVAKAEVPAVQCCVLSANDESK